MSTAKLLSILQGAVTVQEQPLYITVQITFSTAQKKNTLSQIKQIR